MSQPLGHNELAASPRLSRAPSCRATKAHMSHMSHMSRHRPDEGASLWVHARGSQLHIAAKCMTQYAQAKQLPSIAHGEVCEIEARADCAADNSRRSRGRIDRSTALNARAEPSSRLHHMLQLIAMRCSNALAQHRSAHVTRRRRIELDHFKRRPAVVVPHLVAANAV